MCTEPQLRPTELRMSSPDGQICVNRSQKALASDILSLPSIPWKDTALRRCFRHCLAKVLCAKEYQADSQLDSSVAGLRTAALQIPDSILVVLSRLLEAEKNATVPCADHIDSNDSRSQRRRVSFSTFDFSVVDTPDPSREGSDQPMESVLSSLHSALQAIQTLRLQCQEALSPPAQSPLTPSSPTPFNLPLPLPRNLESVFEDASTTICSPHLPPKKRRNLRPRIHLASRDCNTPLHLPLAPRRIVECLTLAMSELAQQATCCASASSVDVSKKRLHQQRQPEGTGQNDGGFLSGGPARQHHLLGGTPGKSGCDAATAVEGQLTDPMPGLLGSEVNWTEVAAAASLYAMELRLLCLGRGEEVGKSRLLGRHHETVSSLLRFELKRVLNACHCLDDPMRGQVPEEQKYCSALAISAECNSLQYNSEDVAALVHLALNRLSTYRSAWLALKRVAEDETERLSLPRQDSEGTKSQEEAAGTPLIHDSDGEHGEDEGTTNILRIKLAKASVGDVTAALASAPANAPPSVQVARSDHPTHLSWWAAPDQPGPDALKYLGAASFLWRVLADPVVAECIFDGGWDRIERLAGMMSDVLSLTSEEDSLTPLRDLKGFREEIEAELRSAAGVRVTLLRGTPKEISDSLIDAPVDSAPIRRKRKRFMRRLPASAREIMTWMATDHLPLSVVYPVLAPQCCLLQIDELESPCLLAKEEGGEDAEGEESLRPVTAVEGG